MNKNNKKTLVIMAAGLATRYGGDKQTDGVGPHGETLMEYSVYDAIRAGFQKTVLIIRPEAEDFMDNRIGNKIRKKIDFYYAYQDFSSIPDFYQIPKDRVKPFGTGHALLCAAEIVQEPFCVMNADDYYGAEAFQSMADALDKLPEAGQAVMIGYQLKNTLSESGTVSRGICHVNQDHKLLDITERLKIGYYQNSSGEKILRDEDSGAILSPDDIASMNLWGFTPSFFTGLRNGFDEFLKTRAGDNIKAEYQLPTAIQTGMSAGNLQVSVLRSSSVWFGMTYQKDRANVAGHLRELHARGVYPENLWE